MAPGHGLDVLDPDVLIAKMEEDPAFNADQFLGEDTLRRFLVQIPELFGDILDKPISFDVLTKVKLRAIDFSIKEIEGDNPHPSAIFVRENGLLEMIEGARDMLVNILEDSNSFFQELGVTEEWVIMNQAFLNKKSKALYGSGELTLRKLFELQPFSVLRSK